MNDEYNKLLGLYEDSDGCLLVILKFIMQQYKENLDSGKSNAEFDALLENLPDGFYRSELRTWMNIVNQNHFSGTEQEEI